MQQDLSHLHAAMVIRYEDLVASPAAVVNSVHAFMALSPSRMDATVRDGNLDYGSAPQMTRSQAERAAAWGYGPGLEVRPVGPRLSHPLRSVRTAAEDAWTGGKAITG